MFFNTFSPIGLTFICISRKKAVTSALPLSGFPPNLRSRFPGHTQASRFLFIAPLCASDC